MQPSLLVVVPARGGSKRLPGKNLMSIGGQTLIERTARFLAGEGFLNSAILSTDAPEIAAEGRRCGLSVPFLRPAELATDSATSFDTILHALDFQRSLGKQDPDYVATLQVTSPLRRPGLLRDALARLSNSPTANSVVAMTKLHVPSNGLYCADGTHMAVLTNTVRPTYAINGALYITRTTELRKQTAIPAQPITMIELPWVESIDIDDSDDFELAAHILASQPTRFCP